MAAPSEPLAPKLQPCYFRCAHAGVAMVLVPLSRLQPSRGEAIEEWPWLD